MAGKAPRTLRPQDEISHYRIVGPLGAGGMGEVYLAQDRTLERNVALKILPPDLVRSEERVRRFVLEAKSASSLSHPNIVTIYEIGQESVRAAGEPDSGPMHYISMELVSGRTLAALIHEEKTELRVLLGYLAQAADGLAKAHAAGIVHRDLKPGNIMVTADGFAKVLDFGLAKLTEQRVAGPGESTAPTEAADATGEGIVVGTAGYMSPEQVQGKAVDHRSDIFSFGCILYEAATRRRPFEAETGVETMHRILHDKPTPVEEINDRVPAELRRLIRRCLAKSPDQRLQSIKDLALDLREIADEYETLSASASSGSMAAGAAAAAPARRVPPALWIAAGAVVVASLAVAWWALRHGAGAGPSLQDVRVSAATDRSDVQECALSPDGRYLAYLCGQAGPASLRVRQVATGSDVEVLPTSNARLGFPSFTPDGDYLFYCVVRPDRPAYRTLYQVASLGGTPRQRAFDVDSRVSFSPDGRQFAFWRGVSSAQEWRLVVLDADSGKERILARVVGATRFEGGPAWSPDGRRIAGLLQTPTLSTIVTTFDLGSGRRRDLVELRRTLLTSLDWRRDGRGLVTTGIDLKTSLTDQVFLIAYPGGSTTRVTNDFNTYGGVSASRADGTIAAVRNLQISSLWLADVSGAPPVRVLASSDPETSPFHAAAPDTGTIVFDAPQDRYYQIWSVGTTRGERRPLTSGEAMSVNPRTVPGLVVFDRLDSTGMHVWRMNADGSEQRQLTSGPGGQALSLSDDGRRLLVTHYDAPNRLSVISAEDGHTLWADTVAHGAVGFSPDGREVMIARRTTDARGLTVPRWDVFAAEGGPPRATLSLPDQVSEIHWAPDGRAVTFRDRADPAWNVFRQAIDGGPPVAVTHVTRGRVFGFAWSPDGRKLALRVDEGDVENLWVTEPDGSRPVQVTHFTSELIFGFNWLPDSRRIVVGAGTDATDAVLIHGLR